MSLKFRTNIAAEILKANKGIWQKWFTLLDRYGKNSTRFKRVVWIKVIGIPPHAWDEGNFNLVAGNFGKVLI